MLLVRQRLIGRGRLAARRTECFVLLAAHVGLVGAVLALEVKVLADGVVEETHRARA
ncbi:MAG: hypothetical protein WKF40_10970 [Thermoleophilaceae bacterium]